MSRFKLAVLAVLIAAIGPVVILFMFLQAVFGAESRAYNMELAFDCCGNALFGGSPKVSISNRTGKGVIAGYRWAKILAPIIDFFFGKGHCADAAATAQ